MQAPRPDTSKRLAQSQRVGVQAGHGAQKLDLFGVEDGDSCCFVVIRITHECLQRANGSSGPKRASHCHDVLWPELFLRLYKQFAGMDEGVFPKRLSITLPQEVSSAPHWLQQARKILHAQFAEQPKLSRLAAGVGVHPVHLAREFRKHYGSTVGEYLRRLRTEYACHQLVWSDDPLSKIAAAAGFSDQSHFSRTFKRLSGRTPGQFRSDLGRYSR